MVCLYNQRSADGYVKLQTNGSLTNIDDTIKAILPIPPLPRSHCLPAKDTAVRQVTALVAFCILHSPA